MRCDEFEDRLQERLDQRLAPWADGELTAHAAQCPACRATWTSLIAATDAVAGHPRPAPSAELTRRVMAEISGIPAVSVERASSMRRIIQVAAMALAASLLVALGLALWPGDRAANNAPVATVPRVEDPAEEDPHPEDTGNMDPRNVDVRPEDAPPAPRAAMDGEGTAPVAAPMREVRAALAEAWLLAPASPVAAASSTGDDAAVVGWGDELATGLRPLADSTADAFSFLLAALPEDPAQP
jgi:hypothetical protein